MGVSTFMGLETNLRGLLAAQQALDVTSHNIANAGTAGYSRQTAVLVASPAFAMPGVSSSPAGPGQLGTGVDVAAYQRIRDSFLDVQYRAQSMLQGQAQANQNGLQQVQLAFNEQPTSTGLSGLLANYWSAWQNLSNNPEDMGTRQALAQSAASLADGFTSLSSQLSTLQSQTSQNVSDTLTQVNSFGSQIGQLNLTISKLEAAGNTPNDLLDQRDVLLDKLSALGNVSATAGANGSVNVSFGGASLVAGGASSTLAESDLTGLTSGKLQGLITLRDTTIPGYQAQLNTIASTLISKTNTQSALGFDLNGNPGGAFFTGTDASNITVNSALITNPSLIAASSTGAVGDAQNALAIADLQSTSVIGASTIDTAYTQLVTQIGSDVQQSTNQVDTTTALVNALQNSRQSVSGVNLDEEMTNLIRYQRGYQASSRALNAMDSMLDQLINRTGRVGL
jgi:flagellar hook-associated protein 1